MPAGALRILLVVHGPRHLRHLRPVLEVMAERGHEVVVRLDTGDPAGAEAYAPGADCERLPPRPAGWTALARQVRLSLDHLRYLEPEYDAVLGPAARSRARAPRPVVRLGDHLGPRGRRRLGRLLGAIDDAIPVPSALVDAIARVRPDVVLVSPLLALGSLQSEHVRAARRLGVPSAVTVASWDNLTNKGGLREIPDRVVIWNEAQRTEAIDLHGVPPERLVVTGAHSLDPWAGARPSRDRAAFCRRAGLDPDRPFVLYACSSAFVAPREPDFVARWLEAVGGDGEFGVLIRPHPANRDRWTGVELDVPGRVAVWAGEDDTDYADSILHAAATVGINTTALLEAAVAGRPAMTVVDADFTETQSGTRHFAHLADPVTGVLALGTDLAEHAAQLTSVLTGPAAGEARRDAFAASFVRPLGLDRPAAPPVVDALEALAAAGPSAGATTQRPALTALLAPAAHLTPAVLRAARALAPPPPPAAPAVTRGTGRLRVVAVGAGNPQSVFAAPGHVVLMAGTAQLAAPPPRTDVHADLLRLVRAAPPGARWARAAERAVPADVATVRWLSRAAPDLVVASSDDHDVAKAARALGVPVARPGAGGVSKPADGRGPARLAILPFSVLAWASARRRRACRPA